MDSDLKLRCETTSADLSTGRCRIRSLGPEGALSRDGRAAPLFGAGASQIGSALLPETGLRPGSGQLRRAIPSEVAFAAEDQKLRHARHFASPTPCPREKSPAPQAQMIREMN